MNENNENNFKINNMSDFVDLKKWASLDGFDYTPPMQLFFEQFRADMDLEIENNAVKVCQRYGFEVDKEELKKALAYDRHQYEKGYHDARMAFEHPAPSCPSCIHYDEGTGTFPCCECRRVCEDYYEPAPKSVGGEEND